MGGIRFLTLYLLCYTGGIMFHSIKNKIVIPVALVLIITIGGMGFYSFYKTSQLYNQNIKRDYLQSHIENVSARVSSIINKAVEISRLNAEDPAIKEWVGGQEQNEELGSLIKARLKVMNEELGYFTNFLVSGTTFHYWANGELSYTIDENDPNNSWFFSALDMEENFQLNLDRDETLGDTLLFVNAVIRNQGSGIGITGVGLNINKLQQQFEEIHLTENSFVHLIDDSGRILISSSDKALGTNFEEFTVQNRESSLLETIAGSEESQESFLQLELSGGNSNIIWRGIGDTQYKVVAVVPEAEMIGFIDAIKFSTIFAVLFSLILSFFILILVALSISRPIKQISGRLEEIAAGEADLTQELSISGKDEVAVLSGAFNGFIRHLRMLINNIKDGMQSITYDKDEIATGSTETASAIYEIRRSIESIQHEFQTFNGEILKTSSSFTGMTDNVQNLRKEIENQGSAVEQTSASIEEMNASINAISKTSSVRKTEAEELVGVVNTMKTSMGGIQKDVQQLNNKAEEMTKATELINNISSKTNLLSMNAAIEAAHAGEAGRGFAVVAEEIRSLADHSATNAKNISTELKGSVEIIHKLDKTSTEATEQFGRIEKVTKNTMNSFVEIASTMAELSTGTEEINKAISSLRNISQGVGESSTTIESEIDEVQERVHTVSAMSEEMNAAINEIITGTEQINTAMNELNNNIQDLNSSIDGISGSIEKFKT